MKARLHLFVSSGKASNNINGCSIYLCFSCFVLRALLDTIFNKGTILKEA